MATPKHIRRTIQYWRAFWRGVPDDGHVPPNDQPTQHRRAEKAWWFRDAERSWWQFTFTIVAAAQTMFLAVVSILYSKNGTAIDNSGITWIFSETAAIFLMALYISVSRLFIDHRRSVHFETSVRCGEQGIKYKNKQADHNYETRDCFWRCAAATTLIACIACLFHTGYILRCAVLSL